MGFLLESITQEILGTAIDFLPQFISGILIFLIFDGISLIVKGVFVKILQKSEDGKRNVIRFLSKIVRSSLIIVGLIVMLGTWGVDISALVAGLGLTGFALGFALKDVLSSVLAGVLVLIYKPFSVQDKINVCGVEGLVKSIDMRYTILEAEHETHLIPNSKLLSEKVTVLR